MIILLNMEILQCMTGVHLYHKPRENRAPTRFPAGENSVFSRLPELPLDLQFPPEFHHDTGCQELLPWLQGNTVKPPLYRIPPRRMKFILTMDFHGCPWMSRGTSPWMSMDIHVLLNGIMVKDHGLTDHGQSPWSVKTWSSPWFSQALSGS